MADLSPLFEEGSVIMTPFVLYVLLGVAIVNTGLFLERHWRMYQGTFESEFFSDPVYRWSNTLVPTLIVPITLTFASGYLSYLWVPFVLQISFCFFAFCRLIMNLIWLPNTANACGIARSVCELLIHIYIWYAVWPYL